jgi:hypothetical protein
MVSPISGTSLVGHVFLSRITLCHPSQPRSLSCFVNTGTIYLDGVIALENGLRNPKNADDMQSHPMALIGTGATGCGLSRTPYADAEGC